MYFNVLWMEKIQKEMRELQERSPFLEETYNKFFLENAEIIKLTILLSAIIFIVIGTLLIIYHFWKKSKEVRFSIPPYEEIKNEGLKEDSLL